MPGQGQAPDQQDRHATRTARSPATNQFETARTMGRRRTEKAVNTTSRLNLLF
jgi:hypothetical protein